MSIYICIYYHYINVILMSCSKSMVLVYVDRRGGGGACDLRQVEFGHKGPKKRAGKKTNRTQTIKRAIIEARV